MRKFVNYGRKKLYRIGPRLEGSFKQTGVGGGGKTLISVATPPHKYKNGLFECCKNAKCNFIFPLRQKIGEQHGFNVSGAVSSIADRISAASAVLHVFHVYPVNFEFRFDRPKTEKIHVRTTLDVDGVEKVKGSVNVEDDSELGGLRFQVLHSVTAINFILPLNSYTKCEFEFTKNLRRTEYLSAIYRTSLI